MSRIRIIHALFIALLLGGCTRSELDADLTPDQSGGVELSFGLGADWTRGSEVESIEQLTLYSYFVDGKTWANVGSDDLKPYFTSTLNETIELSSNDNGKTISYCGGVPYYWPTGRDNDGNIDEYLNFYALYPESVLMTSFNETTGKPEFAYTMSGFAVDNDDVVFDAKFDMTSTNTTDGTVALDLEHLLTKLTLRVNFDGTYDDGNSYDSGDGTYSSADDIYMINGITFSGLYDNATLNIDADGTTSWSVTEDDDETIEVTATQGQTLLPIYTYDDDGVVTGINKDAQIPKGFEDEFDDTEEFLSVMKSGEAIFVLPQDLGDSRTVAPTVELRIRRFYYTDAEDTEDGIPSGELLYATEDIEIPVASGTGWLKGQHNLLNFTLHLDDLSEFNTPMTLTSQIWDWSDVDIDVDVHPNVYIYASDNEIEVASDDSYGDMYFYTNYGYDLRFERSRTELDELTVTTAHGFTFYPYSGGSYSETPLYPKLVDAEDNEYSYSISEGDDGSMVLKIETDEVSAYGSTDGGGFFDMSSYYIGSGYGDDIPCYSWDHGSFTGDMDSDVDWLRFRIDPMGAKDEYSFYYYLSLTTRDQLGLYTNSSIGGDSSYGVNKDGADAVYILRIEINESHLDGGYLRGKIGVEMLSNGGGLVSYKFPVELHKTTN